ncbi:hypothetical protein Taro_055733 [Colocasia esculenta]|uniref:Transposase (putative) gypsy type domain-containing protein n=1 Tax=Colocasia esculenta TaxID=4460 RepID=A0A843XRQ7_COLES|nr:hypothetical protein [Colocasia esculenta]
MRAGSSSSKGFPESTASQADRHLLLRAFPLFLFFFFFVCCALRLPGMARKGKEVVEASGMPPVAAKAAKYRSFEGLRERFRIGEEYEIVLMREDESHLTLKPGCFVLSLDLLEPGLRLPMPEIAKELLRSWKVAPIQLTPNSWRTIFVFCIICREKKIEATAEIFRNHFSLACSPQFGMGIVYVKHRTNRMRVNFSPRLSNNKGWTGRLFSVGRRKGANIPEWDFPVRVVEPLRKADMPPFLIREAVAASQLLNTVGVNHAEGYLTEYKLVKYKLSRAWDEEEIAAGRDQKEMAGYAEMIPVSLCSIRLDEGGSAKGPAQGAKAVARGGAVKKALETTTTAGATSLPQVKRKEKRKAAVVESQAGGRSSEEGVSDEPRDRKKRKMTKPMPHVAEGAAAVEEEAEEDLEPLLARRSRQRTGTSEERAPATPAVDRSEVVMKMSAELGLIMVSDESDRSGGRAKSPVREAQEVLPGEGSAEQDGVPDESAQLGAEDGAVASDFTPAPAAVCGSGEAVLPRGNIPQGSGDILPPMPPTSVITEGRVVGEDVAEVIAKDLIVGESASVLGEKSHQAPEDAEEGRVAVLAASATEDGGEVQPATRLEAVGAGRASASKGVIAMTSGSGRPEDLAINDVPISSAAAAAGDESSGDDTRPLTELLHRRLPEVPSVAALEATLRRIEMSPRKLPPSPTASYLDRLERCQDLPAERTPEVQTEEYHPENPDDDVASDVDLEALVEGISTSLGKYLYEAQSAFCKDLTARHKAREAALEEEVKNLKTALQASELNVAVARAEKEALAKVVSDAGVRAVADYKTGSDYKEELEQYGARCYRVGLNAGREFGEGLSWVERAREAFEAAVRECKRRTNDARLDAVCFAQFQSGRMPSSDEGAGPSEQAP